MKNQIKTIVLGILLIGIAGAMSAGETYEHDFGSPILNCSILGNSSNLTGLELSWSGSVATIETVINYKPDNFNLSCWINQTEYIEEVSSGGGCTTRWTCTEWTSCSPAGDQTRTCSYPTNFCKPAITKPVEIQTCNYVAPSTPSTGEIIIPGEQTQTPTGGAGITGAVIGNLTSPTGVGIIIVGIIVLIGGILVVRYSFRKK